MGVHLPTPRYSRRVLTLSSRAVGLRARAEVAHRPIHAHIEVVPLPEQRPLLDPARYLHWSGRGAVGHAQLGAVAQLKVYTSHWLKTGGNTHRKSERPRKRDTDRWPRAGAASPWWCHPTRRLLPPQRSDTSLPDNGWAVDGSPPAVCSPVPGRGLPLPVPTTTREEAATAPPGTVGFARAAGRRTDVT